MRIAQISPFYPPATGGVAVVAQSLSEELAKRGYEVTVFTSDRQVDGNPLREVQREELVNGVHVRRFRSIGHIGFMHYCPGLTESLRCGTYDLVHAHSYRHPMVMSSIRVGETNRFPTIVHEHGGFPERWARRTSKSIIWHYYDTLIGAKLLNRATAVIALTNAGKDNLRGIGVNPHKIRVIPNGIVSRALSMHRARDVADKFGIAGRQVILFIGSVDKTKNPMMLVESMPTVLRSVEDAYLAIVGTDRGMVSQLSERIGALGLQGSCRWLGPVFEEERDGLIETSSVVVLPSKQEGLPLVLLEAMARGKPIVATKTAGSMSLIDHGRNGLLVNHNDELGLAQAIVQILSQKSLSEKLGREAKKDSRSYSMDAFVERIEALYRDVLHDRI